MALGTVDKQLAVGGNPLQRVADQTDPLKRVTTSQRNPYFFIVGFPKSGTSLLRRILHAHPLLAVAPEVDWISSFFETTSGLNQEGLLAWPLVTKWVDQKKFDPFEIEKETIRKLVAPGELVPFRQFVSRVLDLYGYAEGKQLVGSRTPEYMRYLPRWHAIWPQAKFIHLIRDGREVCLSLLQAPDPSFGRFATWTKDPITTIALWWKRKVQQCREDGWVLGPELYYELRYEAMVAHPQEEAAKLGDFLGVPFEEAMWQAVDSGKWAVGREAVDSGEWIADRKESALPTIHCALPTSADAIERFEAAAGDLLSELGYPRACQESRPDLLAHVSALREEFAHSPESQLPSPRTLSKRRKKGGWTNPFAFIVGCPRSGTTLLQRILDAHADLAICPETFWVVYFFKKRIGLTPEGLAIPDLIPRLFEFYKFYRMKMGREELEKLLEGPVPYSRFVTGVFDHYGEYRGKPLVGDKTPDYVRNLATLHSLWPTTKIVHLIRDGRDVCLSAVNWKRKAGRLASLFSSWEQHPVTTAALWWEWHVRQGQESGRVLGPNVYYELRYESLVSRPDEECVKLCDFLGLPFDQAMLNFHEGRTKTEAGLDAKNAWLPITPGLRDWRLQMPAEDIARFEAAAGDLLLELGYPRMVFQPSPEILEETSRLREVFAHDTSVLGDWLP
jgi:hypothetical protein